MALKRANGTGTVYKMKHKKLRKPYRALITVGYDDNGNAIRKSIGTFRTVNEGMRALESYIVNPESYEQKQYTLANCLDMYIENMNRKGSKVPTIYPTFYKRISHLLEYPLSDIRLEHLQTFFDSLDDVAYSTKQHYKTILTSTYKLAIMNDYASKNYATYIVIKKDETEKALHKVLQSATLQSFWKHTDNIFIQLAIIYCYTGLRFDELLRIKIEDIHLKERFMIGGLKTVSGKNRTIPIHECIVPFIERILNDAKGDTVLTSLKIFSNAGIRNNIKKYCYEFSGEKLTPHDFRYTFVTMATNYKMDEHILKLIVGHAQSDITNQVYIHKDVKQLIESINILPYGEDMDVLNIKK